MEQWLNIPAAMHATTREEILKYCVKYYGDVIEYEFFNYSHNSRLSTEFPDIFSDGMEFWEQLFRNLGREKGRVFSSNFFTPDYLGYGKPLEATYHPRRVIRISLSVDSVKITPTRLPLGVVLGEVEIHFAKDRQIAIKYNVAYYENSHVDILAIEVKDDTKVSTYPVEQIQGFMDKNVGIFRSFGT